MGKEEGQKYLVALMFSIIGDKALNNTIVLILIVALIVAYLVVTQIGSLGVGSTGSQKENYIQQA